MRGGILVELLQLEQRDHDVAAAAHGEGERAHHRLRLCEWQHAARLHLLLEPPHRVRFLAQGIVDRRRLDRRVFDFSPHAHRSVLDTRVAHLPRFRRVDGGQREARQHLVQESGELLAAHLVLELEALDTRLRQTPRPVPGLQVPQRQAPVHDLVSEEGEEWMRRVRLQVLQLAIRRIDRALPGGMARGVEGHGGQRLRERREEGGGIAHRSALAVRAAARISGSLEAAAWVNRAAARGSLRQPVASAASATTTSGDLGGSRSRPNSVRPADVRRSSASSAAGALVPPSARIASTRRSDASVRSAAWLTSRGTSTSGHACSATSSPSASRMMRGSRSLRAVSSAASRSAGSLSCSFTGCQRTRASSCRVYRTGEDPGGTARSSSSRASMFRVTYPRRSSSLATTIDPIPAPLCASWASRPRRVPRDSAAATASSNGAAAADPTRGTSRSRTLKSTGSVATTRPTTSAVAIRAHTRAAAALVHGS